MAECESDIRITIETPYLTLTGELWGVYCDDFGENWPRYHGTTLYVVLLFDTDIFYIQMFAMVISTYSAVPL